jgi:hypothetical protein
MRIRHVASVAEGLIPASPSQGVRHAPTIQRGRIPHQMAVNGMETLGAMMPVLMLMSATLVRMRHVASVAEGLIPANPSQGVPRLQLPQVQPLIQPVVKHLVQASCLSLAALSWKRFSCGMSLYVFGANIA